MFPILSPPHSSLSVNMHLFHVTYSLLLHTSQTKHARFSPTFSNFDLHTSADCNTFIYFPQLTLNQRASQRSAAIMGLHEKHTSSYASTDPVQSFWTFLSPPDSGHHSYISCTPSPPRLRSTQPVTEAPVLGFLLALSSSEHQGLGTGVWPSCSYGFLSFSFAIPASKEGLAVLNGHAQSGVTDGYSLGTHCVPGLVLEQWVRPGVNSFPPHLPQQWDTHSLGCLLLQELRSRCEDRETGTHRF